MLHFTALNYSIVYSVGESDERETLVGKGCPIPVRRSNHLERKDAKELAVSISLESASKELFPVGQVRR